MQGEVSAWSRQDADYGKWIHYTIVQHLSLDLYRNGLVFSLCILILKDIRRCYEEFILCTLDTMY